MEHAMTPHGASKLRVMTFALAALGLTLTGCGVSSTTGANTPQTSATSSAAGAGRVTVTLSKRQYASEEPFTATIANGLGQRIWIQGDPSSCSGLEIQRMDQGAWQTFRSCAAARSPGPYAIAAGASSVKRFDAAQGMDTGAGWPAGTYRVVLTYAMSQEAAASSSLTTPSSECTVQ